MAATQTVPQHSRHCNFVPIVPRQGVVTLFGYSIKAYVDRGHLTIQDGIGADRRAARLPRVGHGLRRLVVIGSDGMISLAALRWLADQDAAFVMLDRLGKLLTVTGPVRPSDARLRRAQSLAEESGAALRIARELIRQKLLAQENLVRDQFQDVAAAETIAEQRHAAMNANSKEEIRKCEAYGALAYWQSWHELPIRFVRADLPCVPQHWQTFGSRMSPLTRSPRLAVNPPNAMLNYLYAILESEARLAISELGLDPGVGFLHADTRSRDSLACDVMEPIRPKVDGFVLDWLCRAPLQRKWFFEQRDGNCRLTSGFAATLSETSSMWRQALGSLAEWISHSLWSCKSQSPRAKAPATPLTQHRRRLAKGILATVGQTQLLTPTSISLVTRDPIAWARRAHSQRQQVEARKSWSLSERPEWLDEKFYREKILPSLAAVPVPTIVAALAVSPSYAVNIRAGRVPHPRHWTALAKLTGYKDGL